MKYPLWSLLGAVTFIALCLGVWVSTPDKFVFQQDVNIVGGFYADQVGYIKKAHFFGKYTVQIGYQAGKGDPWKDHSDDRKIPEKHLAPFDNSAKGGTIE